MTFYLTLLAGIIIGLALAGWIGGIKMMIRYIFSLRNYLRMKWLKIRLAYYRFMRRLI